MYLSKRNDYFEVDGIIGVRPGTMAWRSRHAEDMPHLSQQVVRPFMELIEDHECGNYCMADDIMSSSEREQRKEMQERALQRHEVEWNPDLVF